MSTQQVTLGNTTNNVTGDQYNNYIRVESSSSGQAPTPPPFIEAPLDLLSIYFTGRDKELDDIAKTFDIAHGHTPTRCVVHGMHGIGKTQLALQFAKQFFDQQRFTHIFWISATTVEKLSDGFADLLMLVGHPDRFRLADQIAKLKAARRWLENSGSINWLLVLDNVDATALSFLQENLPRRNQQGNILFTTRTEVIATALARTAGQEHKVIELGLPELQHATNLLLVESNTNAISATTKNKAEEVVKFVGQLPLAVSHAASFMKQTQKTLDDILLLFHSEHRTQVRFNAKSVCIVLSFTRFDSLSVGRTTCQHTRKNLLAQHSLRNLMSWNINLRM
jgi:DNA polymerase III delta prime subunit